MKRLRRTWITFTQIEEKRELVDYTDEAIRTALERARQDGWRPIALGQTEVYAVCECGLPILNTDKRAVSCEDSDLCGKCADEAYEAETGRKRGVV